MRATTTTLCILISLLTRGVCGFGSPVNLRNTADHGPLDAFYMRRVLEATSTTFEQVFTDFQNVSILKQDYVSQCLLDFAALFNTPGKNYFKASKGLEAVDALGKPGSNILHGNIQMWGAFDECLSIGEGLIQYWLVPINIHLQLSPTVQPILITPLPIRWGVCVPRSCDFTDLEHFLNITNSFLHNVINDTHFSIATNYNDVTIIRSKTKPLDAGAIAMIVVCAIFLALAFVGSLADMGSEKCMKYLLSKVSFSDRDLEQCSESTPVLTGHKNTHKRTYLGIFASLKKPLEFLTAFSLFKNVKIILSTKQPPTAITCLDGIRVLSMFWIIFGHYTTFSIQAYNVGNVLDIIHITSRFSSRVIFYPAFSVDSFLLLSSTLVAYHTLREMGKRRGRFPVITYYLHRYLRLTMVYAFVLFFVWTLLKYLGNGPTWGVHLEEWDDACNKYWWTNLLYINNFYPWEFGKQCFSIGWYLAVDMQLYVLAPLLLLLFFYIVPVGFLVSIGLIAVTFVINGALAGTKDFSAVTLLGQDEEANDVYIKPYCRAAPYIIGLMLGFLLHKKVRIDINWFVDWLIYCAMWVVAAGCCFSVVYGLHSAWNGHELNRTENVSYLMLDRFTWSVGVALMVFACHNGYGWIVNDFLSMKIWIPLSRLTYSAYLVHYIVLFAIIDSVREPHTYSDYTVAVYTVAIVVLSYGAAGVVAAFVEFPLSGLETLVFKALGLNRRQSVRLGEDVAALNDNEPNAKMSENTATASFTSKQENKEK